MKVLIISKAFVSAMYRKKLEEMARLGLDVVAIAPPCWREAGSVQPFEAGDDRRYRLMVTPMRWNGHFHLHYYPHLGNLIDAFEPDLIHIDEEPYNLATFLAMRSARMRHTPAIFFTWQNLARRYPPPFRDIERATYRWAAGAIAGNREAGEILRAKGFTKPLATIPQFGIDPSLFRPGTREGGGFRIGFPNRLTPGKAPLLALRALERLPDDCVLEIIGDGPMRRTVEQEALHRGVRDRVRLRTRVPSAAMPELLRTLDVVILPSITTPSWKEQFGRILVEAMACGIPVVGSDSGEIPHVIGDAGIVVPEGDALALAAALQQLRNDPDLRRTLAVRGRERALLHFTNERVAVMTCIFYRSLLTGSG